MHATRTGREPSIQMQRFLSQYAVANTCHFDEMRSALVDVYDVRSFVARSDHARFFAKASYYHLGASSLSYCAYGSPVRLEFRDDNYFRLQFGIAGAGQAASGKESAHVGPDTIVGTPAAAVLDFGHDFEQLALRIDRAVLERDLATLLGVYAADAITFALSVSSATGQARRLRENVFHAVASIDSSCEPIPAPLLKELDQTIRLSVLFGLPNNYSSRLYAPAKESAPWQVKRIEDWIDAHWQDGITLEKLVEVSGVSARSIFATFKSARGYGPMAYLKQVRLNGARDMLLCGDPRLSVTGVGLACNFQNLGQFARDYYLKFGERPSETLRHAKLLMQ